MLSRELASWLNVNGFNEPRKVSPVGGGSISQSNLIEAHSGARLFVKQLEAPPSRFFEAEMEGLSYLSAACNLPVPEVFGYGTSFIAMEYLQPRQHHADFWALLGELLACLHSQTREQFGFVNDNYCGLSVQTNAFHSCGYDFYTSQRLLPQAELAHHAKLLSSADYDNILRVCELLPQRIPVQPASLLHGDLWSGNIHVSKVGEPVFIDPAVYYGWAEMDLAMTQLFGGFPAQFYQAYSSVRPLDADWRGRIPLYNLYPLLNHLNLFGGSYLEDIRTILARFA